MNNQSERSYYPEVGRVSLKKDQDKEATLLIGDSFFECDYWWEDNRGRRATVFANKYEQCNTFALFEYGGSMFFIPLGSYVYELCNRSRNPQVAKISENDVIELNETMMLQFTKLSVEDTKEQDSGKKEYFTSNYQHISYPRVHTDPDTTNAKFEY